MGDISKKQKEEIRIEQQYKLFDSMYKHLPVGVIVYDKNGLLVSLNQKNREIMGIPENVNLVGLNLFEEFNLPQSLKLQLLAGKDVSFNLDYDFDAIKGYFPTKRTGTKPLYIKIAAIINNGLVDGYLLINQDMSDLMTREKQFEQTSVKLSTMFDSLSSGIEIYDRNGILTDCNEHDLKIFGIEDKENLIKQGVNLFNNPNLSTEICEDLKKGKSLRFELWFDFDLVKANNYHKTTRNGIICLYVKASPMLTKEKELLGYVFESNEITKSKEQEKEVCRLHSDLELALNAGHVSTWNYDLKTRFFKPLLGNVEVGNYSYEVCENRLHPDDRAAVRKLFEDLESGKTTNGEITFRFYDNKREDYRYFESEMDVRKDRDGHVVGIIGTERDVTERSLKQLELDHMKKSLDMVMEASNVLAWNYDALTKKYQILYGNKFIARHSCVTNQIKNIHPDDLPMFNKLLAQLLHDEVERGMLDVRVKDDDGKYYTFEHTISNVKNAEGKVIGLIGIMYDLSDRVQYQKELEEQNSKMNLINTTCNIIQWDYDLKKKLIYSFSDNALASYTGLNVPQYLKYVHPNDVQKVSDAFALADLGTNDIIHFEMRLLPLHSTEYINAIMDGVAIKDKNGKIIKYTGIRQDVSRWVKINRELRK